VSRASAEALVRRLGANAARDRIAALGVALGLDPKADLPLAAHALADRWAAGTPSECWLVLAVLTARLPTSEQVTEALRAAVLDEPLAALLQVVGRPGSRRGARRVRLVSDEPVVVGVLDGAAALRRGVIVDDATVVVPWRTSVVLLDLQVDDTAALGAMARFSESDVVALSGGLAELAEPDRAAALASQLDALSWCQSVLVASEPIAEELRAWRSMLGGIGRSGPVISVLPASDRPQDVRGWQDFLRSRPRP
jgi:hypothetical protein